ncbi:MAG: flagellar biosynthesis protein FliQ [Rhizobiales bacterium]|nr:flagellar biosynthesis protein FliQ [Paracoccaceae bacterium]NNF80083.1 flagellar biosynthesis protein FliQ [Hyphomicrobiales bacterium]
MNEVDALEIMQMAIWTIIFASGPAVLVAMVVGSSIALFQALTQVQEITLTFIPKIVAILMTISLTGTFMGEKIFKFSMFVFERVEHGF